MKWTQWLAIFGLVLLGYLLWNKQASLTPATTTAGNATPLSSLGGALRSALSAIIPSQSSSGKSGLSLGGGGGGGGGNKKQSDQSQNNNSPASQDPNATLSGGTSNTDAFDPASADPNATLSGDFSTQQSGQYAGAVTAYGGGATSLTGGDTYGFEDASGGIINLDPSTVPGDIGGFDFSSGYFSGGDFGGG